MHMVPCNNAYTAMLRRIERNQRSVVPDAVCMWLRTDCQFMYTNVKCNCHGLCHGVVSPLMLLLLLLLMLVLLLMVVLYRLIRSVLGGKICVGHIRDDGVLISRINYSSMRQIKIFPSIFSLGVRGALFFPLRFSFTLLTLLTPSHHASWFFPLFYSINFFPSHSLNRIFHSGMQNADFLLNALFFFHFSYHFLWRQKCSGER